MARKNDNVKSTRKGASELADELNQSDAEFRAEQQRISAIGQTYTAISSMAGVAILVIVGTLGAGLAQWIGLVLLSAALIVLAGGLWYVRQPVADSEYRQWWLGGVDILFFVILGAMAWLAGPRGGFIGFAFFIPLLYLAIEFRRLIVIPCGIVGLLIYAATVIWPASEGAGLNYLLGFFLLLVSLAMIVTAAKIRHFWDISANKRRLRLEKMATTDALTGCLNQRGFQSALGREIQRAARYGRVLSLMVIDIDYFKDINDTYGHLVGDDVLKKLGTTLRHSARRADMAGRTGGDELAIMVPETDAPSARVLADRLQANAAQLDVPVDVSLSIGIGSVEPDNASADLLYRRADQALYHAKRTGRARSSLFNETDASDAPEARVDDNEHARR